MNESDKILDAIKNKFKEGRNIFLTGQAGTGKTYTLNSFLEWLRINGNNVGLAGSTGVAAINIGGTTVHRLFGIGLSKNIEDFINRMETEAIFRRSHLKRLDELMDFDLIVIDEVSMIGKQLLDLLDYILRQATGLMDKAFGGKQVMFTGDFLQLPPVQDDYAFNSPSWSYANFCMIHLTKVHRQVDEEFKNVLSKLRFGQYDEEVEDFINSRVYNGEV